MRDDLLAKLRAIRVPTKEEALARYVPSLEIAKVSASTLQSQGDWARWYATQKGVEMASLPEMYQWFKGIKKGFCEESSEVLQSFQQIMYSSHFILLSSTRVEYLKSPFSSYACGTVTHHYNLTNLLHKKIPIERMPESTESLDSLSTCGQELLGALFDTQDSCEEIIETLTFMFGDSYTESSLVVLNHKDTPMWGTEAVGALYVFSQGGIVVSSSESIWLQGCSLRLKYDE